MRYCHNCALSISETATFCATCGALAPCEPQPQECEAPPTQPAAAPVEASPPLVAPAPHVAPSAEAPTPPMESVAPASPEALESPAASAITTAPAGATPASCRLCGRTAPALEADGVCPACRSDLTLFVAAHPVDEAVVVSLAGSGAATGRGRVTVSTAIYSAFADDDTCPECRAMDGRETGDIAAAATWAPNPHCHSPQGCRCAVFFEHESLSADEEHAFIDFAASHGLHVTAPAVAAFHDERRTNDRLAQRRLADIARLLGAARTLEKSDPQQAVAGYRRAIEALLSCGEAPLDERRVRRDLPLAFNRLTLTLKALGRQGEALDEIDRAAALGVLERDDCGRKADRDALRNRSRRLREAVAATLTA
jgi:hypothetical protein